MLRSNDGKEYNYISYSLNTQSLNEFDTLKIHEIVSSQENTYTSIHLKLRYLLLQT